MVLIAKRNYAFFLREQGICLEPGCGVFLTKTEKEECDGYCRKCHEDNQAAHYPAHPDTEKVGA